MVLIHILLIYLKKIVSNVDITYCNSNLDDYFNSLPHQNHTFTFNNKNTYSCGYDNISNKSIPDDLKIAKVKPLYKNAESFLFNNYRPISLLPVISKVFEKIIQSQVLHYFTSNNLLSKHQYGFRPKHSTEHAAIKLHDYIYYITLTYQRHLLVYLSIYLKLLTL